MKSTDIPKKHPVPFAKSGDKNSIPQSGGAAGAATLTDGFPPETMVSVIAGGIPPDGKDMNGVLFELSDMGRWANAGAEYTFDQNFSAAIGGYPAGAKLLSSDGKSVFISEIDDNTANPEAVSDKWVGFSNYRGAITATTGVHTLTALEASRDLIVVSGTLTGNVQLVFPAWVKHWQIINSTTGNFSVTCKTATGSGVVVKGGFLTDIYGDGTSISSHANTDVAGVVRSVNTHKPDASGDVKLGTAADADIGTSTGNAIGVGGFGLASSLTAQPDVDLNDLKNFGFYIVRNASNAPINDVGVLYVSVQSWNSGSGGDANRAVQTVYSYTNKNRAFCRTYFGPSSGWSGWVEFFSEAHKPTAQDTGALPISGGNLTGSLAVNGNVESKNGNFIAAGTSYYFSSGGGELYAFIGSNKFGDVVFRSVVGNTGFVMGGGDGVINIDVGMGYFSEQGKRVYSPNNPPTTTGSANGGTWSKDESTGIITQTGVASQVPASTSVNVTFPIPFPNEARTIIVSTDSIAANSYVDRGSSLTKTGFNIHADSFGASNPIVNKYWIATGY